MNLRTVAATGMAMVVGVIGLAVVAATSGDSDAPVAAPAMCPPPGTGGPAVPSLPSGTTPPPQVNALRGTAGEAFMAAAAPVIPSLSAPGTSPGGEAVPAGYTLPAAHGKTGREEAVNPEGQVATTGAKVTFSRHAALGAAYRDYYITMRWNWAAWDFSGHARDIDQAQYQWMAAKPRLVLVTNPRTGKSIIAAAIEAGPGAWVGVTTGGDRNGEAHGWPGYVRGTPAGYTGIVSGFPPTALAALGAQTGYVGENGDDLTYQWAPDQNAVPGPTNQQATGGGANGTVQNISTGGTPGGACAPTTGAPQQVSYNGVAVQVPASQFTTYKGVDYSTMTVQAPNPTVAKAIAAGFRWLGTPYVWGGGGPKGPDNGCNRASCLPDTGFDCSGLTSYVMAIAGVAVPTNSAGQRDKAHAVPWEQAIPGDLIGYPGHISVFLGVVNGQRVQLEAPSTGDFVKVSVVHRDDLDPVVYRWWNGAAA